MIQVLYVILKEIIGFPCANNSIFNLATLFAAVTVHAFWFVIFLTCKSIFKMHWFHIANWLSLCFREQAWHD